MELHTVPVPPAGDGGADALAVLDDAGDGAPGWGPAPGTPLVPGMLAWTCIATGHHRETWLCWSLDLWAPAVVKIVRPGWSLQWTEALGREVRALGPVAHPAVPRLFGDGRRAALPHIALEYLDGPALDQSVTKDGPFPAGDVARVGVLVLGALRALHATGSAHLDISPDNVLLVDRRPRLIDLGASRPLGSHLAPGEILGTNGFLAPELTGYPGSPVTPALDVYSLGATLRSVLDDTSEGAEELLDRLAPLTDPDPGRRPAPDVAMAALIRCAGTGAARPWPRWADRALPRAPRRRRSSRVRAVVPG
ncbi:MAG TPA: protein kinase [Modestobacter sp.]|nr:protein kinase [Modestobacter sp.]